jgi:hypothetical protein
MENGEWSRAKYRDSGQRQRLYGRKWEGRGGSLRVVRVVGGPMGASSGVARMNGPVLHRV